MPFVLDVQMFTQGGMFASPDGAPPFKGSACASEPLRAPALAFLRGHSGLLRALAVPPGRPLVSGRSRGLGDGCTSLHKEPPRSSNLYSEKSLLTSRNVAETVRERPRARHPASLLVHILPYLQRGRLVLCLCSPEPVRSPLCSRGPSYPPGPALPPVVRGRGSALLPSSPLLEGGRSAGAWVCFVHHPPTQALRSSAVSG